MENFRLFQQAKCEVIVKYTNCNFSEHEWIRTGIRILESQIYEKNKNIEARQNVFGSYKKMTVVKIRISIPKGSLEAAVSRVFANLGFMFRGKNFQLCHRL